ncbi:MAG: hypothetical protein NT154_30620, partial [Verrucomicrobia bacterium]|nr:hypothetical protein [Verrucomicrobiota bacterium]
YSFSDSEELKRFELNQTCGLGMPVPTVEQQRRLQQAPKIRRVHYNALGLSRVNERHRQQGLPELTDQEVQVAPFGQELEMEGAGPTAGPETPALAAAALADNSTLKYFPPIRNQNSQGSCAAFSTTYYQMTHTTALARGWDAKNGGDAYRFSPKWTYNMVNGGQRLWQLGRR